jgi:hypothetical protein
MLLSHVKGILCKGSRWPPFSVSREELARSGLIYGEQYVTDPSHDLELYFNIANQRFSPREVPTHLAALYLFGTGRQYRPNLGCLSVAGEAVAGRCMESFGYTPLVRPLGVMPDALCIADKGGTLRLAMVESKSSVRTNPRQLILGNVQQYLIDVKTRATGFRLHYEGYLICSQFMDAGLVAVSCLQLDLGYYLRGRTPAQILARDLGPVSSVDVPGKRLEEIIRRAAAAVPSEDEYLIGVLSEEATRSAMVELVVNEGAKPSSAEVVEDHVRRTAERIGLGQEWNRGQTLVKDLKGRETLETEKAISRIRKPDLGPEEE